MQPCWPSRQCPRVHWWFSRTNIHLNHFLSLLSIYVQDHLFLTWVCNLYVTVVAGKITYQLDSDRRELSVSVTDMLENTDYNLRLCHKGYLCRGTGAYSMYLWVLFSNSAKLNDIYHSTSWKCSCGRWVSPAFQIHWNRVDEIKHVNISALKWWLGKLYQCLAGSEDVILKSQVCKTQEWW